MSKNQPTYHLLDYNDNSYIIREGEHLGDLMFKFHQVTRIKPPRSCNELVAQAVEIEWEFRTYHSEEDTADIFGAKWRDGVRLTASINALLWRDNCRSTASGNALEELQSENATLKERVADLENALSIVKPNTSQESEQ